MRENSTLAETLGALHDQGEPLVDKFNRIRTSVEAIHTWNSLSVYCRLKSASRLRAKAEAETETLYAKFRTQLSQIKIALPVAIAHTFAASGLQATDQLIELVVASQTSGRNILAMLRVQEASQSLTAVFERKYAYAFGFISLYAALISIVLGAIGAFPALR
jgi:hypothetical protein